MLSRTCINYLHTICSYYEGQLSLISEIDVEDEVQAPRIRVTEAAEKVCYFYGPFFIGLYCSVHFRLRKFHFRLRKLCIAYRSYVGVFLLYS